MRKLLRQLVLLICCLLPVSLSAQTIYDGLPDDSMTVRFATTPTDYIADTATTPLWMIGKTHKTFFTSDSAGITAIMTDTSNYYPINANNWFIIKMQSAHNIIVDFWHRYQTDSGHDGGVIEFSKDHGVSWENIKGPCNSDSDGMFVPGTRTYNFYSFADTLANGEPAFTGISGSTRYSRLQFYNGPPERLTSGSGCASWVDTVYIRFRFISDSVADTLDGWMIDSIKVEQDLYPGSVAELSRTLQLPISPNPSTTGLFTFPELKNEDDLTITITNAVGQKIIETPYKRSIDLSNYPAGMYLYRVNGGDKSYSGRVIYR